MRGRLTDGAMMDAMTDRSQWSDDDTPPMARRVVSERVATAVSLATGVDGDEAAWAGLDALADALNFAVGLGVGVGRGNRRAGRFSR